MRVTVGHKIAVGFGAALLVMAVIAVYSYSSTKQLAEDVETAAHRRQLVQKLTGFLSNAQDLEVGSRGYLNYGQR